MPALRVLPDDAALVLPALREALDGGPAIMVRPDRLPADAAPAPEAAPDGVAVVVETSGSTGRPKRVLLAADAIRASGAASAQVIGQGRWLLALPLHYIAGLQVLARSIAAGTEPVALPAGPFDPRVFAATAATMTGARYTSLVPVQLARLVTSAESRPEVAEALASFERILLGGQRPDPRVLERAAALGARVTTTYGASETAGGCVYDGAPLPGVTATVDDGQLLLGGPTLFSGYLDDPERTAAALDGGRYRTGDAGAVEDGRVTVYGRLDDLIVSGGVKVALGEVEQVVREEFPALGDAVVLRVEDAEWGEGALVVADARFCGRRPSLFAVREAVTTRLGRAAAPRRIHWLEQDLPRLGNGKPDRVAIRALAGG
jgi:o-succinylbenzoate---CoA ligase